MNTEDIVDVTQAIEDEDAAPLCPFCESVLAEDEGSPQLVRMHGCWALVHTVCLLTAREHYGI